MTCPVCRREVETVEATRVRESLKQEKIVKIPVFTWHHDATPAETKCRASYLTHDQAIDLAFPRKNAQ